jgi:predicted DNA binding CopG/RHH family protein
VCGIEEKPTVEGARDRGGRCGITFRMHCLCRQQGVDFMKKAYDFSKLKEIKNPYAGKKKAVGINLSPEVVDYFKGLAEETGLPYQKLIDLYLLDCAKKRKKLMMKWVA